MSAPGTESDGRLVPLIVGSALLMQTLDSNIIVNALPSMARSLDVAPLRLNLAITAYLLSTAVFLPLTAWIADRWGARRVFMCAIATFALSSALCGLSQNLTQLLVARILQGAAGAAIAPVGRLVLLKTVPKSELVRAMAVLSTPAILGPIAGPIVGGFIVTYGSWEWIFFLNVPIGLAGLVLVHRYVPDIREDAPRAFDFIGLAWLAAGLTALLIGLESVGRGPLTPPSESACIAGGCLCLWAYRRHAGRTAEPLMDLRLFRLRTFAAAVFGGAFSRLILGAGPFLLAMLLQVGFGYSAFHAGLLTFMSAVGVFFMKWVAPRMLSRFGFRRVLVGNAFLSAGATALHALLSPAMPYLLMAAILFAGGFLRSLQFTSLNALAFVEVERTQMSGASSLVSMGQQLSQALGVAIAAGLLHAFTRWDGGAHTTAQLTALVFPIVAALTLVALAFYRPLTEGVGAEVAGTLNRR